MSELDDSARNELAELAREIRGLVEWHELCGASGLPSEASPREVLGLLDPGRAPSPQGQRPTQGQRPPQPPQQPPSPARADSRAETRPAPSPFSRQEAQAAPPPADRQREPQRDPPLLSRDPAPRDVALRETLSVEEKVRRLAILDAEVKSCTACVLCEKRTKTVFARGKPSAEICFIGEGPGADEDAQGEPFVGKAGQLLDKMIGAMGMQRDDVYICNIVKCRPPENREPLPPEVASCLPYLTQQIEIVQPKVIVTLGNVPLKALFNVQGIMKLRGTWRLYKGAIPVMPTYHPAYVLRNPTAQVRGDVWNDLKLVMKQLGKAIPQRGA